MDVDFGKKKVAFTKDNLQEIVNDEIIRLNPLANTFEPYGFEPGPPMDVSELADTLVDLRANNSIDEKLGCLLDGMMHL